MEENKDSKVIEKTLAEADTRKAMEKLKKEKVEVDINPKKFLLKHNQDELVKVEAIDTSKLTEAEVKFYEEIKTTYKQNIEKYSKAKLQGVMVPLRYKDFQTIKDGVLEALKYSHEFNWDDDIKVRAMMREEHTLTVYLSLKSKDNINKRCYFSLEEIAQETETTIEELYAIYVDNFVLTEQERKNS